MKSEHRRQIRLAVRQYQQPLVRYASRLLRDGERARDVVQETFLRLCDKPDVAADGHLAPWLYRVCRSRAIDLMRKESRMPPGSFPSAAATIDPSQAAEATDDHAAIRRLLDQLPDNQQEVVRLKFQDGLTYKQIAEVTGLTPATVGNYLHTALKTIRTQLHA